MSDKVFGEGIDGKIYYTLASKVVRSEDLSEFVNKTSVLQIQSQVASTYQVKHLY
ncbi:hypothetical protein [Nostoc sp.]|uniref:hypothetical protein n=1 Tax=Nostoc sp. TaxID=1180 RepID=UPI002FF51202